MMFGSSNQRELFGSEVIFLHMDHVAFGHLGFKDMKNYGRF